MDMMIILTAVLVVLFIVFSFAGCVAIEDKKEKKKCFVIAAILLLASGVAAWKLGEEKRAIREQEKILLGVDDKGFYIKRIGTHDFIVNYYHEGCVPVHNPGCPCGWIEGLTSKDTVPSNFNSK